MKQMSMIARYPGICASCRGPITPGQDTIVPFRGRGYVHLACSATQPTLGSAAVAAPRPAAAQRAAAPLPGVAPLPAVTARVRMSCSWCKIDIGVGCPVTSDGFGGAMHPTCLRLRREAMLPPIEQLVPELPTGAKYVAVDSGLGVGGLFMWSGSKQTDREALRITLATEGFEDLAPKVATIEAILRRTLARCKRSIPGRTIVSAVERGSEWAVVQEMRTRGDDGKVTLSHRVLLHAQVIPGTPQAPGAEIAFSHLPDDNSLDWLVLAIRADHQASLGNLSVDDVTGWLQAVLGGKFGGVQTMPAFRQYFVPAESVPDVRRLARALRVASSYEVYEIPAMRSEEATTAILAALEREANHAATLLQVELDEKVEEIAAADGKNGMTRRASTMRARLGMVDAMNRKLSAYAEKFGRPSEVAANQVARLRRNVMLTLQYAESRAQGQDVTAPRLLDLTDAPAVVADPTSDGAEGRFAGLGDEETMVILNDGTHETTVVANDHDASDPDEVSRRFDLD